MPLKKGCTQANVSRNIEEMRKAGHPQNVSVAAGMNSACGPKARPKKKGK